MEKTGKKNAHNKTELKNFGQIMEEMGFNPQASQSSKAAFIKYLAKQAYNVDIRIPEIYQKDSEGSLDSLIKNSETKKTGTEQMSFILEEAREEYKKVD